MERRDYILRMIEQVGRVLIALRDRILAGEDRSEVQRQLQWAAAEVGLDLGLARAATIDTLLLLIAPSGEVEPARCWMVAETLHLDGLEAEISGEVERARSSYEKARTLFTLVAPRGAYLVGLPEATERIRELDRRLIGLDTAAGEAEVSGD